VEKPRKRVRKTFEEKAQGVFVVEGLNAVAEYLKFMPEAIEFVVYKKSLLKNEDFIGKAQAQNLKLVEASDYKEEETGQWSKSPVWASVKIKVKEEDALEKLSGQVGQRVLILDHITDPRNLGAIMRTAAFFGVRYVIAAKDRQVLLTQSSVATAQGAFALCDLIAVTNLSRVLKRLKKLGFWVIGTAIDGMAMEELTMIADEDNLALVMGSEEKGMSRLIEGLCDWSVSIDGVGNSLNSLNVSVATGIVIHRICQKQKKP